MSRLLFGILKLIQQVGLERGSWDINSGFSLSKQRLSCLYCSLPRGPLINNATVFIQVQCRKFEKYRKAERKKLKLLIA